MEDKQKIYIKGNPKRGDEVIKALIDLGGRNSHSMDGGNVNAYYFINPNGIINNSYSCGDNVFSYVKEFYKEVKLPRWQPEYGECFYYIDIDGTVTKDRWNDTFDNVRCYGFNNCFITQEEAIKARNKIQEILSYERRTESIY